MSTSDLCLMPRLTDLYPSRLPLTAGCCRFVSTPTPRAPSTSRSRRTRRPFLSPILTRRTSRASDLRPRPRLLYDTAPVSSRLHILCLDDFLHAPLCLRLCCSLSGCLRQAFLSLSLAAYEVINGASRARLAAIRLSASQHVRHRKQALSRAPPVSHQRLNSRPSPYLVDPLSSH
jgi:hypothetical protein